MPPRDRRPPADPLWYKDAVIYEAHVRAFYDSNGDGMGDFRGLTAKLDYLRDLGITALWLLPFYPSPWRDDGYDIADYTAVHPAYGTMQDFRRLLRAAHERGLRVITELVINHTSDQHPWFQRARRAKPGTRERDFHVWSDTPEKYREARIIFKDFETSNWAWDPVANAYYWHRFYSHQPDLNFDNPAVHRAIFRVMDFWFRAGVDGMRLDAIPYLYEREGTNCENLPETHAFLKKLRAHLDAHFTDRMFLAEANQWPEETVPYFGDGDECHMGFHFPLMPRLFMGIQMEDRFPIIDILQQTPPIPDNAQWATFLRNHDELTLEMVTDEERDYMYRTYAHDPQARINLGIRRRLAPLLGNNRRKIELMNALLFSLVGTPVLYYGDEIGMGDNIYLGDRDGVRTPMQWSADRNAGFSRANPQRLYLPPIVDPEYHYETVNVEAQQANPNSLLWWTRRLIALRRRFKAFGRGSIEFLYPDNRKVLAFLRRYEDEHVLVVANLSRFVQYARFEIPQARDCVPVELFGRTEFPMVTDQPYFFTLGPHAFYWFQLRPARVPAAHVEPAAPARLPALSIAQIGDSPPRELEPVLAEHLLRARWFQGKARRVRAISLSALLPVDAAADTGRLALLRVDYLDADAETYLLPLAVATGERAIALRRERAGAVIAELEGDGLLIDASAEPSFRRALLEVAVRRRRLRTALYELSGRSAGELRGFADNLEDTAGRLLGAEQSNTSIVYDDTLILKLYRRIEEGTSLDLEIGRFLTDRGFAHTPAVLGAIDYRPADEPTRTLAVVQRFIPNEGDAWDLTRDSLGEYFERVATLGADAPAADTSTAGLLRAAANPESEGVRELIGTYFEYARLLGHRTAELHFALGTGSAPPDFAPDPFTMFYQRSLYQSMRNLSGRVLQALSTRLSHLPTAVQHDARKLLAVEDRLMERFRRVIAAKVSGKRIRCHGDYHLGQLLFTGKDFIITDFEGEPIRPLGERRLKRSPLRDVAGMLRSFHYAAYATLFESGETGRTSQPTSLEPWARFWYAAVSAVFLHHYLILARGADILPESDDEIAVLLDAYLLEKAVYELGYELNNRPDWAVIPLGGLLQLLNA